MPVLSMLFHTYEIAEAKYLSKMQPFEMCTVCNMVMTMAKCSAEDSLCNKDGISNGQRYASLLWSRLQHLVPTDCCHLHTAFVRPLQTLLVILPRLGSNKILT